MEKNGKGDISQTRVLEEITKADIVLYKLFLKQASEANLSLNDHISRTSKSFVKPSEGEDLMSIKYNVLWDIKQYYRNVLLQEMKSRVHDKPEISRK